MKRPSGFAAFTLVWAGQLLSVVGTVMTQFALTVWAYQVTGQATALALVGFFSFVPGVVFIPLAGVIVDRANRKAVMMISDISAVLVSATILIIYTSGGLQIWHLCAAGFVTGLFGAFQWPAYSAAISVMLPKTHYARASSMMAITEHGSNILAPILATALLAVIGISGIMALDLISYSFAIVSLLIVMIPQAPIDTSKAPPPILKEISFGFRYILARRGLLGLQSVYFVGNFANQVALTLMPAMILARTSNNNDVLATVQTAIGVGGVVSALVIGVTGGPRRKAYGVLIGWLFYSLGLFVFGLGNGQVWWIVLGFGASIFGPLIDSSNQTIWQSKVPPTLQGRVFSARAVIARVATPLAAIIAGPLADYVFEPMLAGQGKGAGMSLMITLAATLGMSAALVGLTLPVIRQVELTIPDHDLAPAPVTS